jgi:hypothetical protein
MAKQIETLPGGYLTEEMYKDVEGFLYEEFHFLRLYQTIRQAVTDLRYQEYLAGSVMIEEGAYLDDHQEDPPSIFSPSALAKNVLLQPMEDQGHLLTHHVKCWVARDARNTAKSRLHKIQPIHTILAVTAREQVGEPSYVNKLMRELRSDQSEHIRNRVKSMLENGDIPPERSMDATETKDWVERIQIIKGRDTYLGNCLASLRAPLFEIRTIAEKLRTARRWKVKLNLSQKDLEEELKSGWSESGGVKPAELQDQQGSKERWKETVEWWYEGAIVAGCRDLRASIKTLSRIDMSYWEE